MVWLLFGLGAAIAFLLRKCARCYLPFFQNLAHFKRVSSQLESAPIMARPPNLNLHLPKSLYLYISCIRVM